MLVRKDNPKDECFKGECNENVVSGLLLNEAGLYNLWLSQIEVSPISRIAPLHVHGHLFPWVIEFTKEDLNRGIKNVESPVGGNLIPIP